MNGAVSVRREGGVPAKPLVSVIIPTHNRAHRLPRALGSVYAQEGRGRCFDTEIIVVDDGSSDATPETVRQHREVTYIRLPARRGVSAATNEALRASTGRYIAFLDDDDVWLPHKLHVQVPLLEAHPDVDVVYGQSLARYGGAEWLFPEATAAPSGWVFERMLLGTFCGHHASLLVRRQAFEKSGLFDETLVSCEDFDMSLRLAFHSRFLFVPGAVDVYNLSAQGLWLTRAASGLGRVDAARVIEKVLGLLPDSVQYAELKREARARVALDALHPFLHLGDLDQAWATVVAVLRTHPWVARYDWARATITSLSCKRALAAASPVIAMRSMCAEIKAATRNGDAGGRWCARRTVAETWATMAHSVASAPRNGAGDAAYAAACAIAQAPSFIRRKRLLQLIVRAVLGTRVEALCTTLYTKLKR